MTDEPVRPISCQWCSVVAAADATHCAACGAALPLAGPVQELRIPGVTDVDPELKLYGTRPLRIPTGSPTQALAGRAIGAAAIGGPGAILALGALAAVAANELGNASQGGRRDGSALEPGQPSETALELARRMQAAQVSGELMPRSKLPPPPPPPPLATTPDDEQPV
jgi:hypothetical protein